MPAQQHNADQDQDHPSNQNWSVGIQSSCEGELESLKSLTQTFGNKQTIPKKGNIEMSPHGKSDKLWIEHITQNVGGHFCATDK